MSRVLIFYLCFFSVVAFSSAQAEQNASVHNEYHNSTVYTGNAQTVQEQTDVPYGIHTYVDPATGDRVTSVRSKRQDQTQDQRPFYIEPIIRP